MTISPSAFKSFNQRPFIRNNIIFFVGSGLTSVINYIYYPVLGHLLPLSAFGEVQVLLSLFTEVAIIFGGVSLVAANISANESEPDHRNRLISELQKLVLGLMAILVLIGLIFLPALKSFFQLGSSWPIIAVFAALLLGVPVTFGQSYLQGQQRFGESSLINILSAALKLLFSIGLVLFGFQVLGALGGFVLSQLVLWLFVRSRTSRAGYHWPEKSRLHSVNIALLKPELKYVGLVMVVSFVSTLLYSGDILVVKHYFSPALAGAYAGIAVIGRIIFFLTGSISGVLFPAVKREASPADNQRLLLASLAITAVLGGAALAVFTLAPRLVVELLLGSRYLDLTYLLPRLGLMIFVISITNLLFLYHLALRRSGIAIVAVVGGALTAAFVLSSHTTIPGVISSLLEGSFITLLLAVGFSLLYHRFQKEAKAV